MYYIGMERDNEYTSIYDELYEAESVEGLIEEPDTEEAEMYDIESYADDEAPMNDPESPANARWRLAQQKVQNRVGKKWRGY